VRLILIGGCRDKVDEQRVQDLKDLCKHLSVEDNVDFKVNFKVSTQTIFFSCQFLQVNIPFDELKEQIADGLIGIHSMWNEHFGIGKILKYFK